MRGRLCAMWLVQSIEGLMCILMAMSTLSMDAPFDRPDVIAWTKLEINGKHPIIRQLATLRTSNADLANVVARQVFSNALISAGLLDDPRTMLTDINQILEHASRG